MKKAAPEQQWPKPIAGAEGRNYLAYEDGTIRVPEELLEMMKFADQEQHELDVLTSSLVRACQRLANSISTRRRQFWATVEKDIPEVRTEDTDWTINTRTKILMRKANPKETT